MEVHYYVPERVVLLEKRRRPDNCAIEVTGLQQTIWVNQQDRLEVKCRANEYSQRRHEGQLFAHHLYFWRYKVCGCERGYPAALPAS